MRACRKTTRGRFVSYHEKMARMPGVAAEGCDKHQVPLDRNGECGLCRLDAIPSKPPVSGANRWMLLAFATLVAQLARWDFDLIDCQIHTDHLARFGATEWPRSRFLSALEKSLAKTTRRGRWELDTGQ